MRISINESYFRGRPNLPMRPRTESLKIIRDGGFDTIDFSMHSMTRAEDDTDHEKWIHGYRDYCEQIGLRVNQAHAPFFEGRPMPDGFIDRLLECVDDCAVLGADCLVVHGDTWYARDYAQWDYDKVVEAVYEVYAPVVERAEKLGVKIAMETLFEWIGNDSHRVRLCSYVEEVDDIVGRFGCDTVGVCWDFGHTYMAYGNDICAAMERMKSRIIATHTHDNTRHRDNHNLPYMGYINWDHALNSLAKTGYSGDLTFEINYGCLPDELAAPYAKYAHRLGEYMADRFQSFKSTLDPIK